MTFRVRALKAGAALGALLLVAGSAYAEPVRVAPGFQHVPETALEPNRALVIEVNVDEPQDVRRARVRYRAPGASRFDKSDMQLEGHVLRALIPAEAVQPPGVEYYVVVQSAAGKVVVVVASPRFPHRVEVAPRRGGASAAPPDDAAPAGASAGTDGDPSSSPSTDAASASEADPPVLPEPASRADPLEEGTPEAGRGGNVEGRRLPGGRNLVDSDADPFLVQMAVYAAEDPTAFVVDLSAQPEVPPAPVHVVTREQIERMGARTLADVVQIFPGVAVGREVLGYTRVSWRGLREDARVDVVLDGQLVRNPYDGRTLWDLPAELLESVELLSGPLPSALPSPAPFGVLRVTTRRASGLAWRAYGGSFTTLATGGGAGIRIGGLSLFGSGQAQYTDGPKLEIERDSFSKTPFSRDGELFTHAGEASGALALGFDWDLGGSTIFGRSHALVEQRGPYIGYFDTVGDASRLDWTTGGASAGVRVGLGESGHAEVKLFGDLHLVGRFLQLSPPGYETPDRDGDGSVEAFPDGVLAEQRYSTLTLGVATDASVRIFSGNQIKAGFAAQHQTLPSYELALNRDLAGVSRQLAPLDDLALREQGPCALWGASLDGVGVCRTTLSLYVGDAWQPLRGLYLDAGLAFTSFSDVELDLLTHMNPHAGVAWTLFDRFTLRANAATGIRAPTFEERHDQLALVNVDFSNGAYVGNPALQPESVRRLEVGADYRFTLGEGRYTLWSTGYVESVERAIERVDLTGNVEQPSNGGSWEIAGVEGGARMQLAAGSFAYLNVSWLRGYFRAPPDLDGEEPLCAAWPWEDAAGGGRCSLLTSAPQLRANLGVNLDLGLMDLHAWTVLGAERRNNARSTLERLRPFRIPPYALVNVTARTKPLFDVVGLELSAFNLLDHSWQDDVPRPDRMTALLPREGLALYGGVFLEL